MADKNILDKAETLARRLFERLGSKLDDKLSPESGAALSTREIEQIVSKMENAVDANLQADANGVKRLAPNCFKVLFIYERIADFTPQYLDALKTELISSIYEYIVNRRYEVQGQIQVIIASDYFEKKMVVKASFDKGDATAAKTSPANQTPAKPIATSADSRTIHIQSATGENFRLPLQTGSSPIGIGRSSSNRIQLHDSSVSREHCSIAMRRDGQIVIADLGSANGTTLNSSQLQEHEARILKEGDVIYVGDVKLIVGEIA